jgi:hypothetical protein
VHALTADGETLVTGGADGRVRLFELSTGRERLMFPAHRHAIAAIAVAADGSAIATASVDRSVVLWSATGAVLRPLPPAEAPVAFLRFSPDGGLLATTGNRNQAVLWSVATGRILRRLDDDQPLRQGVFSQDGRLLAAGTESGKVNVWEVGSGRRIRELTGPPSAVGSLAFAPDGRGLAVGSWMSICLWELATGEPRDGFTGVDGNVTALAFASDGTTLASGNGDASIVLWDVTRLRPRGRQTPAPKAEQLAKAWDDLAGDSVVAHRAVWSLAAASAQAVPLLRERLLDAYADRGTEAEQLRRKRALEALEKIAALEAEQLLQELARGATQDAQTHEARAALSRRAQPGSLPRLDRFLKSSTLDRWRSALQDKLKQALRPARPSLAPRPSVPQTPRIPPLVEDLGGIDLDKP